MSRVIDMTKPIKEWDVEDVRYALERNLLPSEYNEKAREFVDAHDAEASDEEAPAPKRGRKGKAAAAAESESEDDSGSADETED